MMGDMISGNAELSNLVGSYYREYLFPKEPRGDGVFHVSGYHKLCRILSALGYEVVIEGKPAEEGTLHLGRAHARLDGKNFEVLLEVCFREGIPKSGKSGIVPGFTYFCLEGPTEYARFIADYEKFLNFKPRFFYWWGLRDAEEISRPYYKPIKHLKTKYPHLVEGNHHALLKALHLPLLEEQKNE